jgi:hypothetical protein
MFKVGCALCVEELRKSDFATLKSEGGFASVFVIHATSMFALYIQVNVRAAHLLPSAYFCHLHLA